MQMLALNTSVNTLFSPSHAGCSFLSEQCKFPLGDVDLVRDRPLQNSWIHNFWGYISLLIYWAVIRIQRWTELEDIFKAAEEITRKPMGLVALLQHPWNTLTVPLQQCEMMSVKMGCHASPRHLLESLGDSSKQVAVTAKFSRICHSEQRRVREIMWLAPLKDRSGEFQCQCVCPM